MALIAAGAVLGAVWLQQPAEATAYEPGVAALPHHADYTVAPRPKPTPRAVFAAKKAQRVPPLTGATGLTGKAAQLAAYLRDTYPDVVSIGGVRADPLPDHPSGHALDVMVYNDIKTGDAVLRDVLAQADRFGVRYAIWRQQMYRPNGYVGWMANRGTPTLNHYDHVHITVW